MISLLSLQLILKVPENGSEAYIIFRLILSFLFFFLNLIQCVLK